MRYTKVLITIQRHFDVDFTDFYSEAETYILELPEYQKDTIDSFNDIFNAAIRVFGDLLSLCSYTKGMEKEYFNALHTRWDRFAKTDMRNSTEVQLIKAVGWNRIETVVAETLKTMDKSLVGLVCKLFGWKVISKMPCVIDAVVPIIIYH